MVVLEGMWLPSPPMSEIDPCSTTYWVFYYDSLKNKKIWFSKTLLMCMFLSTMYHCVSSMTSFLDTFTLVSV